MKGKQQRKPRAITIKGVMPIGQFNKIFDYYLEKRPYDVADYYVDDIYKNQCIWWSWSGGSYRGGSCWSDERAVAIDPEDEPNPNLLQLFLSEYFPGLTMEQCECIQCSAYQFTASDDTEWFYGNGQDFNVKSISRSVLLENLQRIGCVE